jgi:glycosyltransferase involved in cell wall biosynthesis
MRWLRNRSLNSAALNIALGERMEARLRLLGVPADRIRVIPNWADGTLLHPVEHCANALRRDWDLSGKFVVGYSGNFGRAHDYATLLDAITRLERRRDPALASLATGEGTPPAPGADAPEIVWLFIGGGALIAALRNDVAARGLTSVRFKPYQPRDRLSESLSAADVHLVSLRPEIEGLIVPSKFYGIAAAGRPTIFIGDSDGEIARLLARHGCGVTVSEGDSAELARVVVDLAVNPARRDEMGAKARRAFVSEFDKAIAVGRWRALLEDLGR